MLDDAVLAGSVHALQDHQHRPATLGVEPRLQIGEPFDLLGEVDPGHLLVDVDAMRIGRIAVGKAEFLRPVDPRVFDDLLEFHRFSRSG